MSQCFMQFLLNMDLRITKILVLLRVTEGFCYFLKTHALYSEASCPSFLEFTVMSNVHVIKDIVMVGYIISNWERYHFQLPQVDRIETHIWTSIALTYRVSKGQSLKTFGFMEENQSSSNYIWSISLATNSLEIAESYVECKCRC